MVLPQSSGWVDVAAKWIPSWSSSIFPFASTPYPGVHGVHIFFILLCSIILLQDIHKYSFRSVWTTSAAKSKSRVQVLCMSEHMDILPRRYHICKTVSCLQRRSSHWLTLCLVAIAKATFNDGPRVIKVANEWSLRGFTKVAVGWILWCCQKHLPCDTWHLWIKTLIKGADTLVVCCCWTSSCCLEDWMALSPPPQHLLSSYWSERALDKRSFVSGWALCGRGIKCGKRSSW